MLEVSHTAANISERLSEVMEQYKIPGEKRVAVVHNNASNMVLCALLHSDNPCWGNVKGVRCVGHTLQLCINAALKTDLICRTIAASRQFVGHFKKSAKATTALTEKQKQQNVAEHKLIQDVLTRWNSMYLMLEHLLEQRSLVKAVLSDQTVRARSRAHNCTVSDSGGHCVSAETYDHSYRAALAGRKCISVCHTAHVNKYEETPLVTAR